MSYFLCETVKQLLLHHSLAKKDKSDEERQQSIAELQKVLFPPLHIKLGMIFLNEICHLYTLQLNRFKFY